MAEVTTKTQGKPIPIYSQRQPIGTEKQRRPDQLANERNRRRMLLTTMAQESSGRVLGQECTAGTRMSPLVALASPSLLLYA